MGEIRTISPVIFVNRGDQLIEGDGYRYRDFRPANPDMEPQSIGLPAVGREPTATEAQVVVENKENGADAGSEGGDPKAATSSATGSASDSGTDDSEKSTPDKSTESNPVPPSTSLLLPTATPAGAAKEKSQHPSTKPGKPAQPAAG